MNWLSYLESNHELEIREMYIKLYLYHVNVKSKIELCEMPHPPSKMAAVTINRNRSVYKLLQSEKMLN